MLICPRCGRVGIGIYEKRVKGHRYLYCAHRLDGRLKWCYIGKLSNSLPNSLPNFLKQRRDWCGGWDLNPRRPSPREPQLKIFDILLGFIGMVNIEEFYEFLKFRRTGEETIRKYLSIFKKLKKGRPVKMTKYTVITYRLLIQFLYHIYTIDLRGYLDLLKVPRTGIDLFVPSEDQVLDTLERAGERDDIFMVYSMLLASGARLSEIVQFLKTFEKQKFIKIDGVVVKYPFTLLRGRKKIFYIYLPMPMVGRLRKIEVSRHVVSSYAKRHNLIRPKYIRKFVAQKMYELGIDPLTIDFIQGRVPRSVLARHYLNLSYHADREYRKYAEWLIHTNLYG